jgi:hypothetical protein
MGESYYQSIDHYSSDSHPFETVEPSVDPPTIDPPA